MTIKEIPGYGESVRRQLEQLGFSQTDLAERSGVSRQTISRAVNHDEVSDRTAERIAAGLGQASGRSTPSRASAGVLESKSRVDRLRPTGAGLCDASDLAAWADRREAQSLLPKVVRRLVLATGSSVTETHFRADEGVQLSGWDGIVHAEASSPFVPDGASGWELGVGGRPKQKAEEDLENREGNSQPLRPADTTFMFVTPRRWQDKEEWARQQSEKRPWKNVRVIDADDLASWLEIAPGVHTWLSLLIGKTPQGAIDLESFWATWSGATRPALTPALLLAGRGEAAGEIRERMRHPGQSFAIRSESRLESIAILFSVLSDLSSDEADVVLARTVVAESPEALRHLTGSTAPLLLVPTFDAEELVMAAVRAGHSVVVPLGSGDAEPDGVVQLPALSRTAVADVLDELGHERGRADKLAGLARRSLTAFRRTVAASPGLRLPAWARPGVGRSLLPALLAGAWNGATPRDREILAALGRRPYEELQDELIAWSAGPDPVVRRRGEAWYLVSREDAWRLLARYLTSDDLKRFEQAVITVLGAVHPQFDLPTDQRWMAGAMGHSPEHSGLIARGLAEAVAVMGALGEGVPSSGQSARDVAEVVVRQLLETANRDWRLWASLSRHLPLLAEAAPDAFLDGVEDGLTGDSPVLARMFADEKGMVFGSSPHTGLLWALEGLAWSVPHLGRVVRVLALLDRTDPGSELGAEQDRTGRLSNRPLASLCAIFRSWLPETAAGLHERLLAIDALRESQPDVAWAVMLSMLPEHHASAIPSSRASFRDWGVDERRGATNGEIARTTQEVVGRLRADAGRIGVRWTEVVERLPMLQLDEYEAIVNDLEAIDVGALGADDKTAIWAAMRTLVGRHRAFRSAKWALPEERVKRLAMVVERFTPSDPVERYGWLFDYGPQLPDGEDVLQHSREERQEAVRSERLRGLELVMNDEGVDILIALAERVDDPFALGHTAGSTASGIALTDALLGFLADSAAPLARLAAGFSVARRQALGEGWVLDQLQRSDLNLSPTQRAALLQVLATTPDTWDRAAECGDEVSMAYWRTVDPYSIPAEHVGQATSELIGAGRPFAAIDLLGLEHRGEAPAPPELVAEALEAALAPTTEADRPSSNFSHSVGELLEGLHEARFDETRLAHLEWGFLPALDRFGHRPRTLHGLLAKSPDFFVEVLSLVYRAEDTEPAKLSQEDQHRASLGYSLLREWRGVPGQKGGGEVDFDSLQGWLAATLDKLKEAGRYTIGLQVLGEVLSGSPADPDGSWPCSPVRNIIEELASTNLDLGIRIGVYNSRGVVSRDPSAGGAQERALAEQYEGMAAAVSTVHPLTARLLRRIADGYRRDARQEDFESEMLEDLGV